tara:strand:- start:7304 stop:8230 length:927 start_codon:yes stop_codon:yes gene_type:complete
MEFITIIILSLVPALIYAIIIFSVVPHNAITPKIGLHYLCGGALSVVLLLSFFGIAPFWGGISQSVFVPRLKPLEFLHFKNFIEIAFIEELSKFLVFLIIEKRRRKKGKLNDHPLATMFYVGMVSLGFAIVENVHYGLSVVDPTTTIMWRSITAVIGHIVFGLFMGYWIVIGRIGGRVKNRSLLDIMVLNKENVRRDIFSFIGVFVAIVLHGVYDLHIDMNGHKGLTTLYMLLIFSLVGIFWCFINVNNLHIKKLNIEKKWQKKEQLRLYLKKGQKRNLLQKRTPRQKRNLLQKRKLLQKRNPRQKRS